MSDLIGDYEIYTPQQLKDILIGAVPIGDANELHSAAIQLCKIAQRQEAVIEQLVKRIDQIEADVNDANATARRVSCYENGFNPD
jgi:hypothetical protein